MKCNAGNCEENYDLHRQETGVKNSRTWAQRKSDKSFFGHRLVRIQKSLPESPADGRTLATIKECLDGHLNCQVLEDYR